MKNLNCFLATMALLANLFCLPASIAQFDWTMASGNASRTAMVKNEVLLAPPLQKATNISVSGEHLVIKDELAYIVNGGTPATLFALEWNENKEFWRFEIQETAGSIGFVPAISGNVIVVSGQNAAGLYGIDRFSGEELWFKAIENPYGKNAIADEHGHFYFCDNNNIFCIKATSGETLWKQTREQGYCTPTLFQDKVLVSSFSYINALDTTDGSLVWQIPDIDANRGHVMVEGDFIYASVKDKVCAYENNQEIWCYDFPEEYYAADFNSGHACLTENLVISSIWSDGAGHSKLLALDKETGALVWEYTSEQEGISAPVYANGVVYVAGFLKNWIIGIEEATGNVLFEHVGPTFWGHPIIAAHKLWIPSSDGISVFEAKSASANTGLNREKTLRLLPNPFSDTFKIEWLTTPKSVSSLLISDYYGRKVLEMSLEPELIRADRFIEIKTDDLPNGVYFINIQNELGQYSDKLIKFE